MAILPQNNNGRNAPMCSNKETQQCTYTSVWNKEIARRRKKALGYSLGGKNNGSTGTILKGFCRALHHWYHEMVCCSLSLELFDLVRALSMVFITLVTNHEAPTLDIPSFRSWWNVRWLGSASHQASMKWMSKVFGWICHTFRDAYSSKHSFNWASLYPCSSQTFEHRPIFVSDQAIEMWHWYQYVYVETVPFWRLSLEREHISHPCCLSLLLHLSGWNICQKSHLGQTAGGHLSITSTSTSASVAVLHRHRSEPQFLKI